MKQHEILCSGQDYDVEQLGRSSLEVEQRRMSSYQHSAATHNTIKIDDRAGDVDADAANYNNIAVNARKPSIPWGKFLFGSFLLALIIYVTVDSLTTKRTAAGVRTFLEWMETHLVGGIFAFAFVYFAATVLFIPGSILTLGSGFVFGKVVGLGPGVALASAVVFVGASSGAIAR